MHFDIQNQDVPFIDGEQLKVLLRLVPYPVICESNGIVRYVNRAGVKFLNADTPDAVLGKRLSKLLPRAGMEEIEPAEIPILLHGEPSRLLFLRDRASDEELRRTRNWLDIVLSSMTDGLSLIDRQYRLIRMNRVDEMRIRESGKDPNAFLGKVVWEVIPDLFSRPLGRKLREVMEQRFSASFEEHCGNHLYEIYLSPTEDGGIAAITRELPAQEKSAPVRESLQASVASLEESIRQRITGLARTIEEIDTRDEAKRQAEQAVHDERRRLQSLMELLPVGIVLITTGLEVIFENRFFRDRFGDPDAKHCYDLLFGRPSPCEPCKIFEVFQQRAPRHWEMTDQKGRVYSLHGFPFSEPDQSPVALVIGIDVTDRKHAQWQLENANRQLAARAEQLRGLMIELSRTEERQRRALAQVLHDELQQLLVAIKFGAEFLANRIPEGDTRTEVRRIADLAMQSITVTRSLTTQLSPPLHGGLAGGLQWLSKWMKEYHGLHVNITAQEISPQLPEEMRTMLFDSVKELLFNVVKHAETNQAEVSLSQVGRHIRITVEDKGKGFLLSEKSESAHGSFGLFSIRERLAILNGKMNLESEPGKGTTVTLQVPLPEAQEQKPPRVEGAPKVIPEARITEPGLARVLVVDDHTVLREGLVEILHQQPGLIVVGEAVDGEQAVQQARELHPTTVLMDVTLPKMSGIDATRIITSEMPDVRVIALSMHSREDLARRMQEAGAIRYLLKDRPVRELVTAIYESMNIRIEPVERIQ